MKLIEMSVCPAQGHVWGDSRRAPGWQTCRRCHMRRRDPWTAQGGRDAAASVEAKLAAEPFDALP